MGAIINFGNTNLMYRWSIKCANGKVEDYIVVCEAKSTVQSVIAKDETKASSNLEAELLKSLEESASNYGHVGHSDLYISLLKSANGGATLILYGKAIDSIYSLDRSISLQASADGLPINTKFGQFTLGGFDALPKEDFQNNLVIESSPYVKSRLSGCGYSVAFMKPLDFTCYKESDSDFSLKLRNFSLTINLPKSEETGGCIEVESASKLTEAIQSQQKFSDFVIKSASGAEFRCHKAFLAAQSDVFDAILSKNIKKANCKVLVLENLDSTSVQALLDYLYTFKIDAAKNDAEVALNLLKTSQMYEIMSLLKSMITLFLSWPEPWKKDVDFALRLFEFSSKVEALDCLKMKAIEVLKLKGGDALKEYEGFKEFFQKNPDTAKELCCTLLNH